MSEAIEPADYVAAALIELAKQFDGGIAHRIDQLPDLLRTGFDTQLPEKTVSDAVSKLSRWTIAYVSDDPLAGTLVRISEERIAAFAAKVETEQEEYRRALKKQEEDFIAAPDPENISTHFWDILRENPVIARYFEFGRPFIDAAIPKLNEENIQARLTAGSDRIVKFSDNFEKVDEIHTNLNELENLLNKDNEVGNALGEKKDVALDELKDLQNVMNRKSGRASYILNLSQRFLSWLGGLVAKTSAETVVKNLTKQFLDWLI